MSRPIASLFLPISASWLVVLAFICSTLISSRRVDIANSARSWSLSAWISAIDIGVTASSRRMRQPHRARMHQRNDADDEQARDQESDPDKHDRFDHELRLLNQSLFLPQCHGGTTRCQLARG